MKSRSRKRKFDWKNRMHRTYLIGALLLIVVFGLGLFGIVTSWVTIPDVEVTSLDLTGQLVLTHEQEGVSILNLATGDSQTLFTPEERGIVTGAALSPDGMTLVLAYAPSPDGLIQFGYTSLYTVPSDGSMPPAILIDGQEQDVIYSPVWASDGQSVYYVRSQSSGMSVHLSIERIAFPQTNSEVVVDNGFAPDVSGDGQALVYVAMPPGNNFDTLFVADGTGDQPAALVGGEMFLAIDQPSISPDGTTIVFSGDLKPFTSASEDPQGLVMRWAEDLFGVKRASAHDAAAANIWTIPVAGGEPSLIAEVLAQGIMLDFSPDGQHIAFVTTQGLYVMGSDGTKLVRIRDVVGFRSVQWVP